MSKRGSYIIVGENIHCTRIRMVAGKFVETAADGSSALVYTDRGQAARLPIPRSITEEDNWKSGKVRHVAVAIQQGLYGNPAEQEAGRCYLQSMVAEQEEAGAWFLDLNVDEFSVDRPEKIRAMEWAVSVIQAVCTVPLSIDSSDPEILEAGLRVCDPAKGKPLVNSVSLERAAFVPIAAKANACIIAGATGAEKMPQGVDERLENTAALLELVRGAGIALGDVYLDPLVYPASVDVQNSPMVIEAIRALRSTYGPEVHFAPGLSNISYGFPKRAVINQVFARLCLDAGCDGGIVDPLQINDRVLNSINYEDENFRLARELLLGHDEYGMDYIGAMRG